MKGPETSLSVLFQTGLRRISLDKEAKYMVAGPKLLFPKWVKFIKGPVL